MTLPSSIDRIKELLAKVTPGPWTQEVCPTSIGHCRKIHPIDACLYVDNQRMHELNNPPSLEAEANVELIIILRNTIESLLAERERHDGLKAKISKAEEEIKIGAKLCADLTDKKNDLEAKLSKLESSHACDGPEESKCRPCDRMEKLERVRVALKDVLSHGLVYENGEVHQANTEEALAALRETEEK